MQQLVVNRVAAIAAARQQAEAGAGIQPDVALGIDAAASEFYKNGYYILKAEKNPKRSSSQMIDFYEDLIKNYPRVFEASLPDDIEQRFADRRAQRSA